MKTIRILVITAMVLLSFSNFGIAGHAKKTKTSDAASLTDLSSDAETLIPAQQALQDFKSYFNKQIAKHNLSLSSEQIDSLTAKSRSLIYESSREGQISQANSRKIQKEFKLYLKTAYPENFKIKRSQNEVNYKLARRRIRATTKDFIVNKLQIKNNTEIKELWDKVKSMVYKKLDKAAYFNDFNELVVDESAIPEIIGKVFTKLEAENPNDNNGNSINAEILNRHKHTHQQATAPEKISAPIAEKLVRLMIRNKGISAKHNDTLTHKIMKEVNKNLKRGRISKEFVVQTTKREIEEFMELKSNVTKKATGRYLDRFIKAMGQVPETNPNEP